MRREGQGGGSIRFSGRIVSGTEHRREKNRAHASRGLPMTTVYTWADRDTGIRVLGRSCALCGRRVYRIVTDPVVRCDGCGCDALECYCPDVREIA